MPSVASLLKLGDLNMKTQGVETSELKDIMIGFLEQNREGMVSLAEWFLNNVMEMEV